MVSLILLSLSDSWFTVVGLSRHCAPSRTEYLARINNESRLKHEIQVLTQTLEQEKHHTAVAIAQAQQQIKTSAKPKEQKPVIVDNHSVAFNIQFYDPNS